MDIIALPKQVNVIKGDNDFDATIIVEPCYPGYGITIGNSLRRVLLSSLQGAAVVGVKIKSADHEFMSLPHIKEDVLEIILNLKQLRMKVHSEEVVRLELEAHGEKEVRARDINANSQVEVVNPDLVLAHITDMAGKLEMEIFVNQGRGYEMVENRENKAKEIGYIEIDSIFSPVLSAGITIENIRVGKMTNWDKLSLHIITDGTITPKEAFDRSVRILIDQFGALVKTGEEENQAEDLEMLTQSSGEKISAAKPETDMTDEPALSESPTLFPNEEEQAGIGREPKPEVGQEADKPKKKRGRPKKTETISE